MIQLLSVADMRESDKSTIENGTPSKELMYRAGEAIFQCVKDLMPPFAIVCGNGNNAGDGYVLAILLKKANIDCQIFRITDRFSKDGLYYYNQCIELGIKDKIVGLDEFKSTICSYPTIIDCIFGTGFHGEVKEPEKSVIQAINASSSYVVSIDINSGLNGDNGYCPSENETKKNCVYSDLTIAIGNIMPGNILSDAKDVCKSLVVRDIGIVPISTCQKIYLTENADFSDIFRKRAHNSNKGTYGYIGLIGGSQNYSGAIRLSNMAACAMRCGSGVVKIAAPASLAPIIMPNILESTFYPLSEQDGNLVFVEEEFEKLLSLSAIAFGMGIGNTEETRHALNYLLLNYSGVLIIDADGLNALSMLDDSVIKCSKAKIVLTPHPKEFSRLINTSVPGVLCKPIDFAVEFANKIKADSNVTRIVLLKGCSTIITDGVTTYITNRGSAGMATAGSGDVLSGVIAAICGYNKNNVLLATAASSYVTGIAGELAANEYGDISMVASDTANYLAKAVKQISEANI